MMMRYIIHNIKFAQSTWGDIMKESERCSIKGVGIHAIIELEQGVESTHREKLHRHIKCGSLHSWTFSRLMFSG